jgi:alkylation response protein AidB-like acyl-CoA dehydrogenase
VPKHQGISFLLIDMASEGVSTRPIRLLSGKSIFCETFFDDVQVPAGQLIGEEGQGWDIAKYLLSFERGMIAGVQQSRNQHTGLGQQIATLPKSAGRDALALRAAELEIAGLATTALVQQGSAKLAAGEVDGAYASLLKLAGTEQNQQRLELANDIAYAQAGAGVRAINEDEIYTEWLRSRANSIEGGSSEIQLNIIARRLLELPA